MKPEIKFYSNYFEVFGHYDDEISCAKMTLFADLYAIDRSDGYAKFNIVDKDKLKLVNPDLNFLGMVKLRLVPFGESVGAGPYYGGEYYTPIKYLVNNPTWFAMVKINDNGTISIWSCEISSYELCTKKELIENVLGDIPKPNFMYEQVVANRPWNTIRYIDGTIAAKKGEYFFISKQQHSGWDYIYPMGTTNNVLYLSYDIDLQDIPGYSSLSSGNHSVYIKNGAKGCLDSVASEIITYNNQMPSYSVDYTFTNCTATGTMPATVHGNDQILINLVFDGVSYIAPKNLIILGCHYKYTKNSDTSATILIDKEYSNISVVCEALEGKKSYLTFTATQDDSYIELNQKGTPTYTKEFEYRIGIEEWKKYTIGYRISLDTGDWAQIRAKSINRLGESGSIYNYFSMGGKIETSGNIMSLVDSTCASTVVQDFDFARLFNGCSSLITAPELPATTLANCCYLSMFYGCSLLTTAPSLPATTLVDKCYVGMFGNCTALTMAPSLPATALATSCYERMFSDCTSLTTAPALPATTLANSCYFHMFDGCTSLTTAPELPATTLNRFCYSNMFLYCRSLTTPPALQATALEEQCYASMFSECTTLTSVPVLPATELWEYCFFGMFFGCTSLYISDTQTEEASYAWRIPSSGVFTNTVTHDQQRMFEGCLGTRSSDSVTGERGESHIYYTQNQPI